MKKTNVIKPRLNQTRAQSNPTESNQNINHNHIKANPAKQVNKPSLSNKKLKINETNPNQT